LVIAISFLVYFLHERSVASCILGSGHGDYTIRYHVSSDPVRKDRPNDEHTQLGLTDYFFGDDQLPPNDANCLCLLVQSGDAEKDHNGYKFSKIPNREELFMPLWSLEEMKALNQAFPPVVPPPPASAVMTSIRRLPDPDLDLRFYQWGGCVRSVFFASNTNVQSLLDKVSSIEKLQEAVGKIRSNPEALGRLIHLDVDPDTFQVIFCFFILFFIPYDFPLNLCR
jgi:hypothetical protein